jgi:hypothetical protein
MEFKDSHYSRLYHALVHEYRRSSFYIDCKYYLFVNSKDIGLKFTKIGGYFEVVDAKKWMLAKIKYGI